MVNTVDVHELAQPSCGYFSVSMVTRMYVRFLILCRTSLVSVLPTAFANAQYLFNGNSIYGE